MEAKNRIEITIMVHITCLCPSRLEIMHTAYHGPPITRVGTATKIMFNLSSLCRLSYSIYLYHHLINSVEIVIAIAWSDQGANTEDIRA